MTDPTVSGPASGDDSSWWKVSVWRQPSSWLSPARTERGKLAATAWIQTFSTDDPEGTSQRTGTGHGRGSLIVAHKGIWIANRGSRTVTRLAPRTLEIGAIQRLRRPPVAIASDPNAVWALGSNGWLWRIQTVTQRAEGVTRLGRKATSLAAAGDLIWVLRWNGRLYGVEPASGDVLVESKLPRRASHMLAHRGGLWGSCDGDRRLVRIDLETGRMNAEIRLDHSVRSMAGVDGVLLAGCPRTGSRGQGRLEVIDPLTPRIASTIELPSQPRALAADGKIAWVACGRGSAREGTIERVDLGSGEVTRWRETSWAIGDLALYEGKLLASMSLALAVPATGGHFAGSAGEGGGHGGHGGHGGGHGGGH